MSLDPNTTGHQADHGAGHYKTASKKPPVDPVSKIPGSQFGGVISDTADLNKPAGEYAAYHAVTPSLNKVVEGANKDAKGSGPDTDTARRLKLAALQNKYGSGSSEGQAVMKKYNKSQDKAKKSRPVPKDLQGPQIPPPSSYKPKKKKK